MATDADGSLRAVFGTMGGDAQPQILLQVAARLFHHGQSPAAAIDAGRWVLHGPVTGFDTWTTAEGPHRARSRATRPTTGRPGSPHAATRSQATPPFDSAFGHAHAIVVDATTACWPAPPTRAPRRLRCRHVNSGRRVADEPCDCSPGSTVRSCASTPTSSARCRCPTPATRRSRRPPGATATTPSSRATRTSSTGRGPPTSSASTRCGSPSTTSSTRATRCCPT